MKRLLLLLIPLIAFSQSSSEDFILTKSVLDAGGRVSSSADFLLTSAFGQPTALGVQSSTNFGLYAGFLSPVFSVSPLSPIQELVIKVNQPDVELWWEAIPGAANYSVYRDTVSIFTPDVSNQLGSTADTYFVDTNAVLLPAEKHFYIVTSSTLPPAIVSSRLGRDQSQPTKSTGKFGTKKK